MSKQPKVYLDYAAATPLDPKVLGVMQPYLSDNFYNPSATYLAAKAVRQDIDSARIKVAHWLGVKPSEIVFTAGGTEANNLAINGVMRQYPESNIVISSVEHESVREPAGRYDCREVAVTSEGLVDVSNLVKQINDRTVLVSVLYANNEIGTIQPIREIAKELQKIRVQRKSAGNNLPLYFHTDACQAGNYLDLHVARLGVDMMTLNGGKLYGPKQSGCLFIKTGCTLVPEIMGGGQEKGLRSGTENVPGIIGFAEALDIAQNKRSAESKRLEHLQDCFMSGILEVFASAHVNGSIKKRLPNNLSIFFPGKDNERLMMLLDERGVQCAVGSACSASKDESSHVLRAIGLTDEEARSTLRFSLGRQTTKPDIDYTLSVLAELLQ